MEQRESLAQIIKQELRDLGIKPNDRRGQHFLTDTGTLDSLIEKIGKGNVVLEIGAGLGQITRRLVERDADITVVEIDTRFRPILDNLVDKYRNLKIVYGDVISLGVSRLLGKKKGNIPRYIVSNLPFHITEPFMRQLISCNFDQASLLIGKRFSDAMRARSEESMDFKTLTLITQASFEIEFVKEVPRTQFYPQPNTDSVIVRLTHRGDMGRRNYLVRRLFLTAGRSPLVKNCLKEGLINYHAYSQKGDFIIHMTQNQARSIIDALDLSRNILDKPFSQMNNTQIRQLSERLRRLE